jgi:CHAD domain-containing protein
MRTQPETERKYEANGHAAIPTLDGLPGVTATAGPRHEVLEATYYDTPDLRLARSGLTMRRRAGGSDDGWHLKVPVGKDRRDEIHLPLDGETEPPAQLAELTLGYTRGAGLGPVARIRTERTTWQLVGRKGRLLAEVTEDHVTAERIAEESEVESWHEVEVELGEASDDMLDVTEKRLRKAGFRRSRFGSKLARVLDTGGPDPSGDLLTQYIRQQIEKIKHYDVLARQDTDDAVHQMRVAVRRLRSALRVFRVPNGNLSVELQWLGRRLSPARDLEVQAERLAQAVVSLPPELAVGPVGARLTRYFGPAQAKAQKSVLKTLRSKRYLTLLDALDNLEPGGRARTKDARRAYRKVGKRLSDGEPHRARKAAKRLRYGLEVLGKPTGKVKKFAKLLGEYQDSVIARPLLRQLGMQAHLAGENGFTYGLLHGREQAIAERAERETSQYWDAVKKP